MQNSKTYMKQMQCNILLKARYNSVELLGQNPIDTRSRFNVYKASIRRLRRLIDVETTSCVYWEGLEL